MPWPEKARAAVSITYDDGLPDSLDRAIPDLKDRNIHGTFYLTTGKRYVRRRKSDWRRAFEQGHEIGSHTVRHPCRADAFPKPPLWLRPALRLERWSPGEIAREIEEAARWLDDTVGVDPWRTFAYPCCATTIGIPPDESSYVEAIRRHHFAARVGGGGHNNPQTVDLMQIKSFKCDQPALPDLIGYCNDALRACAWAVLMFHSIGGRRFSTTQSVHRALLDHLMEHAFWIAPVRDVARHIMMDRTFR